MLACGIRELAVCCCFSAPLSPRSHLELGEYFLAISFSRTDNVISYALLHLLIQLLPLHRQLLLLAVLLAVLVVSSAGVHFLVFAPCFRSLVHSFRCFCLMLHMLSLHDFLMCCFIFSPSCCHVVIIAWLCRCRVAAG
jgi:hypothetical protein